MKVNVGAALRAVGTVFASIALLFVLMMFVLCMSFKDIVQNGFILTVTKESLREVVPQEHQKDVDDVLDKVANYPETNEIIESILNDYLNYSTKKDVSDKTVDLIIEFCKKHKDDYEKLTGETVDIADIDTPESREELRKSLNQGFQEVIEEDDSEVLNDMIIAFNTITSPKTLKTLATIIIVLIVTIMLLSWSYYKWMLPVGIVSIVGSVFTFIIYGSYAAILKFVSEESHMSFDLSANYLLYAAIIEICVGIVLLIIQSILGKRERENQSVGEVTTV